MSGQQSREFLNSFKLAAKSSQKGILFASASGRFSEGADFPEEELEAAKVIGIPFEKLNIKIKAFIRYYNEIYGRKKGRYYAYTVPALRKVSQALGRVIRSENDKGYFVLADERFLYKKIL
jgi:DNA excision repair protein ERCC-2